MVKPGHVPDGSLVQGAVPRVVPLTATFTSATLPTTKHAAAASAVISPSLAATS